MNTVGLMQRKGVMLTLHGIHCVHAVDEQKKQEIHLLYLHFVFTSFMFIICEVLVKVVAKKSYKSTCLFIRSNSHHHDMTSVERYVSQSTIF